MGYRQKRKKSFFALYFYGSNQHQTDEIGERLGWRMLVSSLVRWLDRAIVALGTAEFCKSHLQNETLQQVPVIEMQENIISPPACFASDLSVLFLRDDNVCMIDARLLCVCKNGSHGGPNCHEHRRNP